jgi:hypothetical protein
VIHAGIGGFYGKIPARVYDVQELREAGYWILDTGYWILDTGYWILDTGYWILDTSYNH